MQYIVFRFKEWVSKNKLEFALLVAVLLLAAFLRLYRIDEYLVFLGDEGRDVIIVRRLLVEGDFFLIGPGTSIGNMYLGPIYYYMMALPLFLFNYSPTGPAVQVALLGVVTVGFIWYVVREWFPSKNIAGPLIAAFLYAIAPTVIFYSRSSWNPNIMPFFALLSVFSLWRVLSRKQLYWLPVLGVSFAVVLQSHYLGLLLMPALALFWLYGLYLYKKSKNLKPYLLHTTYCILVFLVLMSPLVLFDARHGWRNFESMKLFFTERQTTVSARPWSGLPELWPTTQKITTRLVAAKDDVLGKWVALSLVAGLVVATRQAMLKDKNKFLAFSMLGIWLLTAFLGLSLYKQEIYDHYYGFFFAAPFILIGGLTSYLLDRAKVRGWWLVGTALVFLVYFNFLDNPLRYPPNNQLKNTVAVAEKIREEARGKPFNLAVLAERNYEAAYQYFLERWDTAITKIDPLNAEDTITRQLFVVCELPREKCDPAHDPKTEIANFGWSKIEQEWEVAGVTLFKLVHAR